MNTNVLALNCDLYILRVVTLWVLVLNLMYRKINYPQNLKLLFWFYHLQFEWKC